MLAAKGLIDFKNFQYRDDPTDAVILRNSIVSDNGVANLVLKNNYGQYATPEINQSIEYSLIGMDNIAYEYDRFSWGSDSYAKIPAEVFEDCLSADPLFASAATGDFHLKSKAGRWSGNTWVNDAVTSPAIDAGDPASVFAAEPAPNGGTINLGFYGNTTQASKTVTGETDWASLSGEGRYDTMEQIVAAAWGHSRTVIVATGTNFPDALAASSLGGAKNAPVVLTASDSLTQQARETIESLAPDYIYIIGGTNAITPAVEGSLKGLVSIPDNVKRLAGADRYDSALRIFAECAGDDSTASLWGDTAIVASGMSFADALSISPFAFAEKAPIFLSNPASGLSNATKQAIYEGGFKTVVIVGGYSAVPSTVEADLLNGPSDIEEIVRLHGENRYLTSAEIAVYSVDHSDGALSYNNIVTATGMNFPDALAGGAFAGRIGTILLLIDDSVSGRVGLELIISHFSDQIDTGYFLGGINALPQTLRDAVIAASRL